MQNPDQGAVASVPRHRCTCGDQTVCPYPGKCFFERRRGSLWGPGDLVGMNDFPDSVPSPRFDVDMNQVTREAMGLRAWRCEFVCQGITFLARVEAANEAAAHSLARHQLRGLEGFSAQFATLVACVEI